MTRESITAAVLKIVGDQFETYHRGERDKVTVESTWDGLEFDSLDRIETTMKIEEEFDIEVADAEADEIRSVQQAVDWLVKTLAVAA